MTINIFNPQKAYPWVHLFQVLLQKLTSSFISNIYKTLDRKCRNITLQKKYVDDILITFDQNNTNKNLILNRMNNIHKHLQLKITEEE